MTYSCATQLKEQEEVSQETDEERRQDGQLQNYIDNLE